MNYNFQIFELHIGFFSTKRHDVTKNELGAHLYHLSFIWQKFERNQRTFFSTKKPPIFENWSWIFFRYKNVFADVPNFRTFISPELHLKKFWAKSKNIFGTHPSITHPSPITHPSVRQIKKILRSKMSRYRQ